MYTRLLYTLICAAGVSCPIANSVSPNEHTQSINHHAGPNADSIIEHLRQHPFLCINNDTNTIQTYQHDMQACNETDHITPETLQQHGILDAHQQPQFSSARTYEHKRWHFIYLNNTREEAKKDSPKRVENAYRCSNRKTPLPEDGSTVVKDAQNDYKIHLMPRKNHVAPVVKRLLQKYDQLPKKEQHIAEVKFKDELFISRKR